MNSPPQPPFRFPFKLFLLLTLAGLIGVASMLLWELPPGTIPEEVTAMIPPETLPFLILINPAVLTILATALGSLLVHRAGLNAPVTERLAYGRAAGEVNLKLIVWHGVVIGVISGVLIIGIAAIAEPYLPVELTGKTQLFKMPLLTRVLYGGITEELLLRYGVMTFLVWLIAKITKRLSAVVYWSAIVMASVLFALGHLPIVFQTVPEPSAAVFSYVIIGNTVGGLLFGFAYWKRGIECAMIAHAVAHLTMAAIAGVTGD